jgi:hypothetical protein
MNFWKPIALCSLTSLVVSVGASVASAQGACHSQPNMESALDHLRQARASLDHAESDKGGWRERAIQGTDTAIREATTGCAAAPGH